MNKKYAFWYYDQFPYITGGKVISTRSDGMVESLGKGYFFHPIKIVSLARGLEIQRYLDKITAERKSELETLEKGFLQRIGLLLKNLLNE